MYEHRSMPLLAKKKFYQRVFRSFITAGTFILISLLLGIIGYHYIEQIGWIDALLNASMILTGMGPVDVMKTTAGKIFASGYALFSGVVFLTSVVFVIAPIAHRLMHKFHLEEDEK